jgi:hypothetical protein
LPAFYQAGDLRENLPVPVAALAIKHRGKHVK